MRKVFAGLGFVLLLCQSVQAQAPFYQGKTITIVVGTKAGDAYDLYPRMLAEFMPKYIPGNPNIIVQNVPGAASMIAANQVYNVARPDGLTIGAIYPALYFDQLAKKKEVRFDWTRFGWIGSPVTSNHLLYMRADAPYRSMDDIRNAATAPKCGSNGVTSTGYYLPKLMEETLGTRFNIVLGYQSGQDVDLAVERGEVVCRAFTITAYFAREPFITWRKNKFVNVLMQSGAKRDARLKDAPTIYELMDRYKTSEAGRSLAKVVLSAGEFGRPLVLPPGVPADRVKILRDAFTKALADPGLQAAAEKRKLELDPAAGEELEKLAKEVIGVSPAIATRVGQMLSGK
ncbi:MAG TPA: tripartite tricarboxylate transporter substrate-binding protein [candidate division Zixibacteria bacterium]|nr:tripartite tricarboxylate transporter substrate-binding protein [candidate division Zixibacteria bacterium]